jgi:hypothetical protein
MRDSDSNLMSGDGQPFTFNFFHDYIFNNLHTTLTNRQLVSQSFVVEPTEKDGGGTGTVAHILQLSAIQGGKEVIANGVGVLQIGWNGEEMKRVLRWRVLCWPLSEAKLDCEA